MRSLREIQPLRSSSFDRYFDHIFNDRLLRLFSNDESASITDWAPAVDIKDEAERFLIRVDLPGVDPKDVEVTLDNGVLSIRGERNEEKSEEREGYRRAERFSGSFFRQFTLPDAADGDAVTARADKGVLEIIVPKSKQSQAKRITVKG
jgi:HSP20 family protein